MRTYQVRQSLEATVVIESLSVNLYSLVCSHLKWWYSFCFKSASVVQQWLNL